MRAWQWGVLSFLLLLPCLAHSQNAECVVQGKGLEPVAFESITVSTVAIGLTAATITATAAAAAYVTLETGASLRWQTFGTPTATTGHLVDPPSGGNATASTGAWFCGRATLLGFRAIRSGGTDAVLRVSYFRQR